MTVVVKVKLLRHDAKLPRFARLGDACADLFVCDEHEIIVLDPGEVRIVYTGLALEIAPGYEGIVRGRSGLSSRGIVVLPGCVDSTYRGNIGIMVMNCRKEPFAVERGDRLAHLAIREVPQVVIVAVDELGATERGDGGFGSSGT